MDHFFSLTPEKILDSVENALSGPGKKVRTTGSSMTLNSLENRVFDLELEDESHIVVKYYRPDRWTKEQIQEEHNFLFALDEAEIPVVMPLKNAGESLFESQDGIYFCAFPKVKGRLRDELSETQLQSTGRYLARMHAVGATRPFRHRLKINTKYWGEDSLNRLLDDHWIDLTYERRYREIVEKLISKIDPMLRKSKMQSVHGDCHLGNILWQGEAPFFVDFDDSMVAPPVQDVWLVVRGRGPEADEMRECLLSGYEEMRDFDYDSLKLIEPLRALRLIHYSAWIAKRWKDPLFKHHFPNFGSSGYWEEEINALQEIERLIK